MPTPIIPDSPEFDLPVELPRSTEPPELWLVRLFGALVLHALLFFGVRLAWAEIAVSQAAAGEGGTIEFVEISETADQSAKPKAEGVAPLTALKPGALNKATIVPDETAPDETAVISPAKPQPLPSSSPSPSPTNSPSPSQSPLPQPEAPKPKPPVSPKSPVSAKLPVQSPPIDQPKTSPAKSPSKKLTPKPTQSQSPTPSKSQAPVESTQPLPTPQVGSPNGATPPTTISQLPITPNILASRPTARSAGELKGEAILSPMSLPPGLAFQLSPRSQLKAGSRFDVRVRISVSAPRQQVIDADSDGKLDITILPDSPALQGGGISPAELRELVNQVMSEYRFEVNQDVDAARPADVTEWDVEVAIQV
jgi:hypothetical protein